MCELESGLMCKTRDVITQTPVRWVRTRAIVFELGSWCWDPRLRCYIGPLVIGRIGHISSEQCKRSPYGGHKGLNAAFSWPHWPCCFSMIRTEGPEALVAMG